MRREALHVVRSVVGCEIGHFIRSVSSSALGLTRSKEPSPTKTALAAPGPRSYSGLVYKAVMHCCAAGACRGLGAYHSPEEHSGRHGQTNNLPDQTASVRSVGSSAALETASQLAGDHRPATLQMSAVGRGGRLGAIACGCCGANSALVLAKRLQFRIRCCAGRATRVGKNATSSRRRTGPGLSCWEFS